MSKIYAKKQGRVCTVYLDEAWQPIPFTEYSNPPQVYSLLQTMSEGEIAGAWPDREVVYLTEKRSPPPAVEKVSLEKRQAIADNFKVKLAEPAPKGVSVPAGKSALDYNRESERILVEFRILLAKYQANTSDDKVKISVEAVGNFIANIWPELLSELESAKGDSETKKFSL